MFPVRFERNAILEQVFANGPAGVGGVIVKSDTAVASPIVTITWVIPNPNWGITI